MWGSVVKFYEFLYFLVSRFFEDRGTQNAGSLTYTTLFAVVPMLTVLFVMLAGIPAFQGAGEQIQHFIFSNFIPSSGDKVQEYLKDFISQARQLTWVGVLFLIVTTFMMLITIEESFNNIWRVKKLRRGLQSFLLYWALLSFGPLLLAAGVLTSTYVMSLSFISGDKALPWLPEILHYAPLALSVLGFTLIYFMVPNTRVPFKHAFAGGVFTAFFLDLARWLFTYYVKMFPSYQLIYGAFAAVPLFLLWIYISWIIVLVGCELSCCLGLRRYLYRKNMPDLFVALAVMKVFYDAQQKGTPVTNKDIHDSGWALPEDERTKLLAFFVQEQLICNVNSSSWALCRDIHQYSLFDFVTHCPWPLPRSEALVNKKIDTPWFSKIRDALSRVEQAEREIFEGSLASWLQEKNELIALSHLDDPEKKLNPPTTL